MKILQIDRQTVRQLREAIDENLKEIADEMGVEIKAGSATFSREGHVTFKVECSLIGKNGEVQTKEAIDFKTYEGRHGLPLSLLGQTFSLGTTQYKLVGYKPRSKKFPIVAECVQTRKKYKIPLWQVQTAFGQRAIA
jgi:hypothetical protein